MNLAGWADSFERVTVDRRFSLNIPDNEAESACGRTSEVTNSNSTQNSRFLYSNL